MQTELWQTLNAQTYDSLYRLWDGVIAFIPSLVGALVIMIVGLIVAAVVKAVVEKVLTAVRLDSLLRKIGLETYFERAGLRINSGRFFGLFVYWFFVIVAVMAATEVLHLEGVSIFLGQVVMYIPKVIVSIFMMLAAVVLANFLRSVVRASILSSKLHASKFLGTFTWWMVVVFGFIAALDQLQIFGVIIYPLIVGVIGMIALAGGIAFGLGGKDYAGHLLEKLREQTEEN